MPRPLRTRSPDTAARILDVAERLVQRRGFNAVSYADVAKELKVTTASLHYHFPGKAELGRALMERYAERFCAALEEIERTHAEAPGRLRAYSTLYLRVLEQDRFCLCGMLAAEYQTLPEDMRQAVIRFLDDNETWLTRVLDEGRREGSLRFTGSAADVARAVISSLEGAMLVARPYGDTSRFEATADQLVASLTSGHPEPA